VEKKNRVLKRISNFPVHTPTPASPGFTLIEILVVLLIIAIITSVAVLAFGQFGRGRREKIIAQQFARVITVAQQQAILTPSIVGLGITENGYQFYQFESNQWENIQNDVLSNTHAFQSVFIVKINSIAGYHASTDSAIKTHGKPTILFLPSGFVTPFSLNLKGESHQYNMIVKNNGITVLHRVRDEKK